MQFPPEAVREIAQLLAESDLGEVSFEAAKGQRLTIKRKPKLVGAAATAPASAEIALEIVETTTPALAETGALLIASPCVGVFHADKNAVEVGSPVKARQPLGTVESLKVPNDLYAPSAGVVSQMWVSDGQGVEWGQPLFEIAPSASAADETTPNKMES